MKIPNGFKYDDLVTGMSFEVVEGEKLDHLKITNIQGCKVDNRDLWFTKDGKFDGTGSSMENVEK